MMADAEMQVEEEHEEKELHVHPEERILQLETELADCTRTLRQTVEEVIVMRVCYLAVR